MLSAPAFRMPTQSLPQKAEAVGIGCRRDARRMAVAGARIAQQLGRAGAVEDGPDLVVRSDLLGRDTVLAQATSARKPNAANPEI